MKYNIPLVEFPKHVTESEILIDEELPQIRMKNIVVPRATKAVPKGAFHEKKLKNQKVNVRKTRADRSRSKKKK